MKINDNGGLSRLAQDCHDMNELTEKVLNRINKFNSIVSDIARTIAWRDLHPIANEFEIEIEGNYYNDRSKAFDHLEKIISQFASKDNVNYEVGTYRAIKLSLETRDEWGKDTFVISCGVAEFFLQYPLNVANTIETLEYTINKNLEHTYDQYKQMLSLSKDSRNRILKGEIHPVHEEDKRNNTESFKPQISNKPRRGR